MLRTWTRRRFQNWYLHIWGTDLCTSPEAGSRPRRFVGEGRWRRVPSIEAGVSWRLKNEIRDEKIVWYCEANYSNHFSLTFKICKYRHNFGINITYYQLSLILNIINIVIRKNTLDSSLSRFAIPFTQAFSPLRCVFEVITLVSIEVGKWTNESTSKTQCGKRMRKRDVQTRLY